MILPDNEEKSRDRSPYNNSHAYQPSTFAPSSTSAPSSAGSSRLRPPQSQSWQSATSASETALPLQPPSFPSMSRTASHTYIPVAPAQPSSFSRSVPPNLPHTPFPPMFLLAQENSLKRGFPCVPPPSPHSPHPFMLYDVNETDWTDFLDDLRRMATLSQKDKHTAYCVPILSTLPLINVAVASAITYHIQRKKPALVSLLVDKWNHHFFHPRRLEAILMRGPTKLSGQSDTPIAGLYTPQTVNFNPASVGIEGTSLTPTPAPIIKVTGLDSPTSSTASRLSPTASSSLSPTTSRLSSPPDRDSDSDAGRLKPKKVKQTTSKDKTYRLFVVSLEG
ncbi:hypothetical protein C8R43DRAFT_975622 [Mycena crocata]|nr:hypothetical protein C8R43DRAFT_975622 [Mycena crocata]